MLRCYQDNALLNQQSIAGKWIVFFFTDLYCLEMAHRVCGFAQDRAWVRREKVSVLWRSVLVAWSLYVVCLQKDGFSSVDVTARPE